MTSYKVTYDINGKLWDLPIQRTSDPLRGDPSVMTEVLKHILEHQAPEIDSDDLRVRIVMVTKIS
ncbi:hypothetical protein [Serratia liquefaciens]|uniref:hypothetical protein n=1 Tax=Serratia liquefaciens TaxID=614 RepID=UPI0021C99325|nr:hypothetical protein [Serratia liquefaciens]